MSAGSADWRVYAGKLFITELLKCCASRFAAPELGEGFLFTPAVGHSTLILKVNRLWAGIVRIAAAGWGVLKRINLTGW